MKQGFVFDIEADALYDNIRTIWYIRAESFDKSKVLSLYPFKDKDAVDKLQEFVNSFPDDCLIAGHNILKYDVWALRKVFGLDIQVGKQGKDWFGSKQVQFVDTLYLSLFLNPDLQGHSLEDWGDRLKVPKMNYRQALIDQGFMPKEAPDGHEFSFWNPLMKPYCDQDVTTNLALFKHLNSRANSLYKNWDEELPQSFLISQKGFYLMGAQENTGYLFDLEKARGLEANISDMIQELADEVEPQLPPRPLKATEKDFYEMPAKPFKKDGSISSTMQKWLEKHDAKLLDDNQVEAYGKVYKIVSNFLLDIQVPMQLKDTDALKDYFLTLGWEPVFYNFKKDARGKPIKDDKNQLILTTPKIQEQGKIDPGLLELTGEIPKRIVRYLSLRNRLGVLQGWMKHPRIQKDGRLPARASKITNTHRQAHAVVCNVPKAEEGVLLGKEFRSLFKSSDGFLIAAADAVAGENFTEAHYAKPYPGGDEYVFDLLQGDPHLKNAKAFFPESFQGVSLDTPGLKDDPKIKPFRSKAKSGKYALNWRM